jgi:LacI family transcriptional regulator
MARSEKRTDRVTLADVAQRAGVSTTTASFVLSGRQDMRISTGTADRVLQAARVLDYAPRLSPRSALVPGLPALGLISDTVATEPFAGEMIRGGIVAAAERGHSVIVAESEGARGLEAGLVKNLLDSGVGRFVYAAMATRRVVVPQAIQDKGLVLLNCLSSGTKAPAIVPDERAAGVLSVETLVAAGHGDRVWLVGEVVKRSYAGRERLAGITAAMQAHGLNLREHVECTWWPRDARVAMTDALAAGRARPSAVIALNDRVALGVYQALAAAGLRIPDDVSVISFDDSDLARWLHPELSSIALPHFDMGRRAVEVLLGAEPFGRIERVPMPLHSRDSVAGPTR